MYQDPPLACDRGPGEKGGGGLTNSSGGDLSGSPVLSTGSERDTPNPYIAEAGTMIKKTLVRCSMMAMITQWHHKYTKSKVVELIQKHFHTAQVLKALSDLNRLCGLEAPSRYNDTKNRTALFMYAQNLTSTMYDMMNKNMYPDYGEPAREIQSLPFETFSETEIGLSVRMEKLEKAVQELVMRPAGPPNQAGYLGAALERGRSISQRQLTAGRATTPVRLGGGEAAALPGISVPAEEDQSTYADRVKRTRQDDEGFVLQGRKRRQNVAKGSSKVDLSDELGEAVSAPLLFYVGNTNLPVTKEILTEGTG